MLSLLEILECVEILSLPKVQYSEVSVHLVSGRLVHVSKPVDPTHGVDVSRSHEAGGRGWNSSRPINEVAGRRYLKACSREVGDRIGAEFPLQDAAVLGRHQHADSGTRCIDGCSGH